MSVRTLKKKLRVWVPPAAWQLKQLPRLQKATPKAPCCAILLRHDRLALEKDAIVVCWDRHVKRQQGLAHWNFTRKRKATGGITFLPPPVEKEEEQTRGAFRHFAIESWAQLELLHAFWFSQVHLPFCPSSRSSVLWSNGRSQTLGAVW